MRQRSKPIIDRIFFDLLNKCNFKCDFCPASVSIRPEKKMDFSLYERIIQEVIEKNIIAKSIALHVIGEPLVCPDTYRAAKLARKNGIDVNITTNGALLTRENIAEIIDANPSIVIISLNTTEPDEHICRNTILDFKTYYDRVLNGIAEIRRESNIPVYVSMMNMFFKNLFDIDFPVRMEYEGKRYRRNLAKLIYDIKTRLNQSCSMKKIERSLKHMPMHYQRLLQIDDQISIQIQLFADWGNAFTTRKVYPSRFGYCTYALKCIAILNDGTVTLCVVDFDGHTALGNVNEQPLYDILTSERTRSYIAGFNKFKVVHPYCQRCLGSTSRWKLAVKGILSVLFFKTRRHPLDTKAMRLNL